MSKVQLHKVIALVGDKKKKLKEELTRVYQMFSKAELFEGSSRSTTPMFSELEGVTVRAVPDENKKLVTTVKDQLLTIKDTFITGVNAVATQDIGNTLAVASLNLEVDGRKLEQANLPATNLLYLESLLKDVKTMVEKAPLPKATSTWTTDETTGISKTDPFITYSTTK